MQIFMNIDFLGNGLEIVSRIFTYYAYFGV